MKIFRNLLLILATVFVFELTFTNEAKAACTTDDNGAIELAPVSYTHLTLPTICSV